MKEKVIVSAILGVIVEILLYNPMNMMWTTLFGSLIKMTEVSTGEIQLKFLIALKILEFGIFLLTILGVIELFDRIINSDNYRV